MTWSTRLWERAYEWADRLVVDPVRAHVDNRITQLEGRLTMASTNISDAVERLAQIQVEGFANVRTHVAAEIERARANGDRDAQEGLARLDAGLDSLAAGFAQFVSDPQVPVEPSTETVPPVIDPHTPDPAETVPNVHDSLPVNPVEVVDDPEVSTPNDGGSAGGPANPTGSGNPDRSEDAGTAGAATGGDTVQGATPEGAGAIGSADAPVVDQASNVNAATAGEVTDNSDNASSGPATP